jgi:hypothetical protein
MSISPSFLRILKDLPFFSFKISLSTCLDRV